MISTRAKIVVDTIRATSVLYGRGSWAGKKGPVWQIGVFVMSISRLVPPLDYLRAASRASLQSFELARLNHAANLRREIAALIDQWIQETSAAPLVRWL